MYTQPGPICAHTHSVHVFTQPLARLRFRIIVEICVCVLFQRFFVLREQKHTYTHAAGMHCVHVPKTSHVTWAHKTHSHIITTCSSTWTALAVFFGTYRIISRAVLCPPGPRFCVPPYSSSGRAIPRGVVLLIHISSTHYRLASASFLCSNSKCLCFGNLDVFWLVCLLCDCRACLYESEICNVGALVSNYCCVFNGNVVTVRIWRTFGMHSSSKSWNAGKRWNVVLQFGVFANSRNEKNSVFKNTVGFCVVVIVGRITKIKHTS